MKDAGKTKRELMDELAELRREVAELRASEARRTPTKEASQLEHGRLMNILASMHDQVCIINSEHDIDYLNPAAVHTFGPLRGRKCYEFFHGRTEACSWCMMDYLFNGNSIQWVWASPENLRTYEIFDTSMRNADGTLSKLRILHDISEHKQTVEALRESEERYRSIVENAPVGIFQSLPEGKFLSANPALARALGYESPAEFLGSITDIGRQLYALQEKRHEVLNTTLARNGWVKFDNLDFRRGDSIITANLILRAVRDETGALRYLEGFVEDVTNRKLAEQALRESEMRYRALVEQIPAITYTAALDEGSTTSYVSPQVEAILGFSQQDYQANPDLWQDRLHPEDREQVLEQVAQCHTSLEPFVAEYRMIRRDGKTVWFRDEADIVYDDTGKPLTLQGVMFDISASKTAQEAMRNQLDFLETLINTIPSPIFYKNAEGVYIGCNKAFEAFLGVTRDQIIGNTVQELAPEDLADKYLEMDTALFRQPGVQVYEASVLSAYATRHDVIFNKSTFLDSNGDVAGLIGVILDITQRKRAEEALRESEKDLRFLSTRLLTAQEEERKRVARELHDSIGSTLAAIKISLGNLLMRPGQQTAVARSLKMLISMTQQAIEESRRIMTDLRPSVLDDFGIVRTIRWFCEQFLKIYPGIHVEQIITVEEGEVPEPLKIVIFRVIQEALNNVAKYSKAGFVTLSLVNIRNGIALTLEDDGVGFDPGKTANTMPGDLYIKGLGLTGMKERVELSGGTFSIQSILEEGTTIRALWSTE